MVAGSHPDRAIERWTDIKTKVATALDPIGDQCHQTKVGAGFAWYQSVPSLKGLVAVFMSEPAADGRIACFPSVAGCIHLIRVKFTSHLLQCFPYAAEVYLRLSVSVSAFRYFFADCHPQ
jgi:hypothetical protein